MAARNQVNTVTAVSEKAKRLVIKGSHLKSTACKRKAKDGATTFIHVKMEGRLNATVIKAMDWEKPSKGIPKGSLLGKLNLSRMIFNADGEGFEIDARVAQKFQFRREFDADGHPKREIYIQFEVVAEGTDNIGLADNFFSIWGSVVGETDLIYTMQQGAQASLPGTGEDDQRSLEELKAAGEIDDDDEEEGDDEEDDEEE